jgi:hypothetical protein
VMPATALRSVQQSVSLPDADVHAPQMQMRKLKQQRSKRLSKNLQRTRLTTSKRRSVSALKQKTIWSNDDRRKCAHSVLSVCAKIGE